MSASAVRLHVESGLFSAFPGLRVGGFAVRELDRASAALDACRIGEMWAAARSSLAERHVGLERLTEEPEIREWREAFALCGLKPSTYRSSVEALARRVLKAGEVATPLPVVTAYCAVSVRHLAPLGAYDLDRLPQAALALRGIRPETDRFEPLGGGAEHFPLSPRVAAYASGDILLCWSFNHRDSRATCVQPDTRSAVFFGESLTPRTATALEAALGELGTTLASLGARVGAPAFADAARPELMLEDVGP